MWNYYRQHGRMFPWRKTSDPYKILVSEIMLQQTQADRVVNKYREFVRAFPTFRALSRAPLRDVLQAWQGLGYNRRALHLKAAASEVVQKFGGRLPSETDELMKFPGVGQGTAGAIHAFAFNLPSVFIETNIRAVFLYFFFRRKKKVGDEEIFPFIQKTLDQKNPREWYWALMDYGAMLKKTRPNPNRRSAHYAKQSPFRGSTREERSKILKAVLGGARSIEKIRTVSKLPRAAIRKRVLSLEREGFIERLGRTYGISL